MHVGHVVVEGAQLPLVAGGLASPPCTHEMEQWVRTIGSWRTPGGRAELQGRPDIDRGPVPTYEVRPI
jgi:hypothetical protein